MAKISEQSCCGGVRTVNGSHTNPWGSASGPTLLAVAVLLSACQPTGPSSAIREAKQASQKVDFQEEFQGLEDAANDTTCELPPAEEHVESGYMAYFPLTLKIPIPAKQSYPKEKVTFSQRVSRMFRLGGAHSAESPALDETTSSDQPANAAHADLQATQGLSGLSHVIVNMLVPIDTRFKSLVNMTQPCSSSADTDAGRAEQRELAQGMSKPQDVDYCLSGFRLPPMNIDIFFLPAGTPLSKLVTRTEWGYEPTGEQLRAAVGLSGAEVPSLRSSNPEGRAERPSESGGGATDLAYYEALQAAKGQNGLYPHFSISTGSLLRFTGKPSSLCAMKGEDISFELQNPKFRCHQFFGKDNQLKQALANAAGGGINVLLSLLGAVVSDLLGVQTVSDADVGKGQVSADRVSALGRSSLLEMLRNSARMARQTTLDVGGRLAGQGNLEKLRSRAQGLIGEQIVRGFQSFLGCEQAALASEAAGQTGQDVTGGAGVREDAESDPHLQNSESTVQIITL